MAFRASNIVPVNGYTKAKTLAWNVRGMVSAFQSRISGGVNSDDLFTVADRLDRVWNELNDIRTTPGIGPYAQSQENDGAYDVAAEFTAFMGAIAAARDEIISAFPTQGGYLLSHSYSGTTRVPRQFTAVQLAGLSTLLQAIIDAVE